MTANENNVHQPPRVTFHGAAQSVTGSMHLVEAGGKRLLLDCGIVQGFSREAKERRGVFPFPAASIDAVLLSHAHVDHCGNLPALVRQGFHGPIYCTTATRSLIALMLSDSARIQEENSHVEAVVHGANRNLERGSFSRQDVLRTIALCQTIDYNQPRELFDTLRILYVDAGHLLGSASIQIQVSDPSGQYAITFSGDLGRRGLPYLHPTSNLPPCDLLLCESTYGGRRHDTSAVMAEKLAAILTRTAERGGKVLIPAFSLGRTQLVLFYLRRWMAHGILPRLPLFVDSPLAVQIANVHEQHPEAFQVAGSPDDPPVHFVASADESNDLAEQRGPFVVVASGGMCEGGRIVGHLKANLDDPRTCIVLVSYQAPDCLGARLLEHKPTVRFHGKSWNKWAEVVELNGFSGHADHDDLVSYLTPLAGSVRQVALVHGDFNPAQILARSLFDQGFRTVAIPARDQVISLA